MAWDRSIPATSSALASAPVRANFQSMDQSHFGPNLVMDPLMLIWPFGDALAPAHYALVGTGGAIARETGAGNYRAGGMSSKVTLGSADTYLEQTLIPAGELPDDFKGRDFSCGVAIKTATASLADVKIYDGVGEGASPAQHTGGNSWEWIMATRTLDASADRLTLRMYLDVGASSGFAFFDLPTMIHGPIPPQGFLEPPVSEGVLYFAEGKDVAATVVSNKYRFMGARPFIVRNVSMEAKDQLPTDADLIVDVNNWTTGGGVQSMFSTRPQIDDGAAVGGANPDHADYWKRCFKGRKDDESRDNGLMIVDVDQIGSTNPGAGLYIMVRILQYQDPFAGIKAF